MCYKFTGCRSPRFSTPWPRPGAAARIRGAASRCR